MEPAIHCGDRVLIVKGSYREGDIIAFYWAEAGGKVIHRIYKADDGVYRTFGDNNFFPDNIDITRQDIYGKMILKW